MPITMVEIVSPAPRGRWNELVASDRCALPGQTPAWLDAVCAAGGFDDRSQLYDFGDRSFVLPLVSRRGTYGPHIGYGSKWGIGGLVGPDLDSEIVSNVLACRADANVLSTHIRPNPLNGQAWLDADSAGATVIPRRAHVIDLAGGLADTEKRFRKSARRGIRAAERHGVEVTVHLGGDRLDTYYHELFVPTIARWADKQHEPLWLAQLRGKRADPLARLRTLATSLGDDFRLYLASIDSVPIAGNIVLWGPSAHATRGAFRRDLAPRSNAPYLAELVAITDACDEGLPAYHLGESGHNQALSEYKERFGAVAHEYAEFRIERIPLHAFDQKIRGLAKRLLRFNDLSVAPGDNVAIVPPRPPDQQPPSVRA